METLRRLQVWMSIMTVFRLTLIQTTARFCLRVMQMMMVLRMTSNVRAVCLVATPMAMVYPTTWMTTTMAMAYRVVMKAITAIRMVTVFLTVGITTMTTMVA